MSRWRAGERGTIAIEAAIILPLLLLIFLGMVEFSQAWTVKRRVQSVASTTADLVAQSQAVTTAQLNDIASIGAQLMLPFSSAGIALTITSVAEDFSEQNHRSMELLLGHPVQFCELLR